MASGYVVPERPDWTRARLAPAGDSFAAVRWHDGAPNVWIGSSSSPMQLVSDLQPWRLRDYAWSTDGRGLILSLEVDGIGQRTLVWLDLRDRMVTRLTPGLGADARFAGQGPAGVLMAVRYPHTTGSRLRLVTPSGAVLTEWQAPDRHASSWLATPDQAIAVCVSDGACTWWHTPLAEPAWTRVCEIPVADAPASRPLAFSADGQTLFALSSAGRDTLAVVAMSAPSWTPKVVAGFDGHDVTSVLMSPDGTGPDLVVTTDPEQPQHALTSQAQADLARLRDLAGGRFGRILGRNATTCLAEVSYPVGGPAYVTYSRAAAAAGARPSDAAGPRTEVAAGRPMARFTAFAARRTQPREPLRFLARDGLAVTGFVTRPGGPPPWPVVLAIHDGPWTRDFPQLDPWAESLAAAGLCCVQVNYRGSAGFGKAFRDAGDRQWSAAMQDDLVDALTCEQVRAIADPGRVAAVGYGYGGYAALMLATQREVPVAAVGAAGAPTDLVRYVTGLLSLGGRAGFEQAERIGHPAADHDRLVSASPVSRAGEISAPVLLVHGRRDAEVPVSHAISLAGELTQAGHDCSLTIYEDEGHRITRPQNVADVRTRAISFLCARLSPRA